MDQKIPPSRAKLELLLANSQEDIVQELIDCHKLEYRIESGKLLDSIVGTDLWLRKFISIDPDTVKLKDDIHKLAKCIHPVLITGETGTGKELIARSLIGDRKGSTVAVNCAGFPETLIESELFGYKKGAFTDASGDKQGLMAKANDGVLFLDEVGELPMPMQAKLLRAIQDKKIRRVGGVVEEDINCKFVCATNCDIKDMVSKGLFRQDLYARISTFELHIKPLSKRRCDIIPIIKAMDGGSEFLEALSKEGKSADQLEPTLNVRSLQQYVTRYQVLKRIVL